jgi:hypothetical protein
MSLMESPLSQLSTQNKVYLPSPITVNVDALKNAWTSKQVLIGNRLQAHSLSVFYSHNHLACSAYSLRSVTPRPPRFVGLHTVSQATMHLPLTEASCPAQKNLWHMASVAFLAQGGRLSAIIE